MPRLATLLTLDEVETAARRRLPRAVYDFVAAAADAELTLRENRTAWDRVRLIPRTLVDVSRRDLSTTVLGIPVALPVLLAPAGQSAMLHPDAEVATARAAGGAGTVFVLSIGSSKPLEAVAAAATAPLWFQLYLWRDRGLVRSLVERAREQGFAALCLTVDAPVSGHKLRNVRNRLNVPFRPRGRSMLSALRHPAWLRGYLRARPLAFANLVASAPGRGEFAHFFDREMHLPDYTWDDVAWLRESWDGPIVLKGILDPDDARRAVERGVQAVVVSNHGGRQLDGVSPAVEALPDIVAAVDGAAEVYLDGGVRRGSDVVKAIALGAQACLIGRPYLFGLAVGGEEGVAHVLDVLRAEIDRTLALVGRPTIAALDRTAVRWSPSGPDR